MSNSTSSIVREINNLHIHEAAIMQHNLYCDYRLTMPMNSFHKDITISEYALDVKNWLDENVKNDYCFAGRPQEAYCTVSGTFKYYYPRIYFRHQSDLLAFRLCWGISV